MPKRTNDFQRLIATIYDQLTGETGTVTESAMVYDRDAKSLREVDVLVEYRYAHHNFRLMIECRDRARKDTVEWIDSILGKLDSLHVDKVVAVSKEGFTESAIAKAESRGVVALSVDEAVDTDWERFPIKPGVAVVSEENYKLIDVLFRSEEGYRSLKELDLRSSVSLDGETVGTIKEVFEHFFLKFLLPAIQRKVKAELLDIFVTREDLSKTLYVETDQAFPGFTVEADDDQVVDISTVQFIIHGTRQIADLEQSHRRFNDVMVSTSHCIDADGSRLHFCLVQDPETKKLHGRWSRTHGDDEGEG